MVRFYNKRGTLVADQLAAAAGENQRTIDQACTLLLVAAGREPSDTAVVWWHAGKIAAPPPVGCGLQNATNFGDEIARQRDKCLITRSEKRRFQVFMPTRSRAGPFAA